MRAEALLLALIAVPLAARAAPGTPWTDDTPLPEEVPPPPPTEWDKVCLASRAAGDPGALEACEQAMLRDPHDADLALITGTLLAGAGRYDDALVALDRAIRLQPDYRDVYLQRVRVLAWKGDFATATERLDEIDARWPGWTDARSVRADLATWQGDTAQALALLEEADPSDPEAAQRVHRLQGTRYREIAASRAGVGDVQGAGEAWRRVLALDPSDVDAASGYATALAHDHRLDEALEVLDAALLLHPDDATLRAQRVRVLAWLGEWDDALAGLADLRDDDVDTTELASQLGMWRREAERWGPALSPPGRLDVVYGHTFVTDRGDWDLTGAVVSWRHERWTFGLGGYVERRVYGQPDTDVAIELPVHVHLSPRWRVQAVLGAAPGASFRPQVSIDLQPGYEVTRVLGLGLDYRFAHYRTGSIHRIAPSATLTVARVSVEPTLIVGIPAHGKPTLGEQIKVYFWPEARYMAELWVTHGAEPLDDTQFVFDVVPARELDVALGVRGELTDRVALRLFAAWSEPLNEDPLGGAARRVSLTGQLTYRFGRKPEAEAVQ